jgi:RimJ/RimL family protein N-acetyltransferase
MSVEIVDGDLLLRTPRADDTNAVYEAVRESMTELQPWMPWCHPNYSITDAREWATAREEALSKGTECSLAICLRETGALLGVVALNAINREYQSANLGYWVRSAWTRRGIASNATRLMARYGLSELHLNRIEIIASVKNIASQRAALKAGARREGIARKRLLYQGQPHDAVIYSLIAEDFNL